MGRHLPALILTAACLLAARSGEAQQLLNLELSGGAGLLAQNEATSSRLSPPFFQLQLAYLPLRVGPVQMGPLLGVPVGFYRPEGLEGWRSQVGLRAGWQVYGRPNVDFAWSAQAGVDFVITPLDDDQDPERLASFVWGLELGGAVTYFLTAGFGLTAGLRYAFFYGVDPIHVISGQLGLMISYEVLR